MITPFGALEKRLDDKWYQQNEIVVLLSLPALGKS